jgi:quinol monooxygenase YgiN
MMDWLFVMRAQKKETRQMFSLTSRIVSMPGLRDALAEILVEGCKRVPGCLSYVITNDPADQNTIWINEVWESAATHRGALSLPQVKRATSAAMQMIMGVGYGRTSHVIQRIESS